MKKTFLAGMVVIGLLLATVFGIYFMKLRHEKADSPQTRANLSRIVDVDEMVKHPDRFKGFIGVAGKAIKVDESKASFVLGCEDACVMMPVKYRGQIPDLRSDIIVYGEIKETQDGKYIFEANEIKAK